MRYKFSNLIVLLFFFTSVSAQILEVPEMTVEEPAAGKRVKIIPQENQATGLHYSLYLPKNWEENGDYPVIVEYTGNKFEPTGSTGYVKDASLGYAIAENINAIWVTFPYVKSNNTESLTWWGDISKTKEFIFENLPKVCLNYGGNSGKVFLIGFSRGAVGVNHIGLHDDEVSDIWRGFFSHDHYDGAMIWYQPWSAGSNLTLYREQSIERIERMQGRAALISNSDTPNDTYVRGAGLEQYGTISYLKPNINPAIKDVPNVPHPHTDKWLLSQRTEAQVVFDWFENAVTNNIGVFTVSGYVKDNNDNPIEGMVVKTGKTHFAITDQNGFYQLEGLSKRARRIQISETEFQDINIVDQNQTNVNFVVTSLSSNNFNNTKNVIINENPVGNTLKFSDIGTNTVLKIYTSEAKQVLEQQIKDSSSIDVSFLSTGLYIYTLQNNSFNYKNIFVKK